jgi:hypothetical protein
VENAEAQYCFRHPSGLLDELEDDELLELLELLEL